MSRSKRTPTARGKAASWLVVFSLAIMLSSVSVETKHALAIGPDTTVTINRKGTGYRGIWYMNQPSGDEYVYKYSGGLGTYCAKHRPFAVYRPEVEKTFFCYGGASPDSNTRIIHMVSYYDHRTGKVPRPTILLDKKTNDAHDNPVISIDKRGHVWIFSSSHGRSRPSYIHRSREPYSIDAFDLVEAMRIDGDQRIPLTNFSYMQARHVPGQGFVCFFTRYSDPADRTLMFMTSRDGVTWNPWQRIAAIERGHYQISEVGKKRAGSAFNFHPQAKGLNWRTNLYYVETQDFGKTWTSADGKQVELPLTKSGNLALVHDYAQSKRNVYLKDIVYDAGDRPIILYVTSGGYQSGPRNDPRTWTTARWSGDRWDIRPAFNSDNNYDMGSLWIQPDGSWQVVAPTEKGPQPYNPGGEVALWVSRDKGQSWNKRKQLTVGSGRNHTYVRRPVDAHPDFYAIWGDGHARKPSGSQLYFCDHAGNVFLLPVTMAADHETPKRLKLKK